MKFENFNIVGGNMGNTFFGTSGFQPRGMIGGGLRFLFMPVRSAQGQ